MGIPYKFYEPRTTRRARTRRNRQYKLSRLELQRTLRLISMNREQRERHEQGPLLPSRLSVPTLEGRGTFSLDSPANHFRSTRDTPFNFHEPRTTRTARTRRSRQYKLSRLGFQRTLRFTFPPSLSGTSSGLQGTLPFSDVRSYKGHSIICSRFSRLSRLESTTDTPFTFLLVRGTPM